MEPKTADKAPQVGCRVKVHGANGIVTHVWPLQKVYSIRLWTKQDTRAEFFWVKHNDNCPCRK